MCLQEGGTWEWERLGKSLSISGFRHDSCLVFVLGEGVRVADSCLPTYSELVLYLLQISETYLSDGVPTADGAIVQVYFWRECHVDAAILACCLVLTGSPQATGAPVL